MRVSYLILGGLALLALAGCNGGGHAGVALPFGLGAVSAGVDASLVPPPPPLLQPAQ